MLNNKNCNNCEYTCPIEFICHKVRKNPLVVWIVILVFLSLLFLIVGFFTAKDLFTAAAVMITAVALLYNAYVNKNEKAKENSKFYLEKYIKGSEMILDILKSDKPKRRVAWVSAAVVAEKLKKFQEKVTEQTDKDFLVVYLRNYMHSVLDFLSNKPVYYFYGVDDATSLADAADKCLRDDGKAVSSLTSQSERLNIDEAQIKSILKLIDCVVSQEVDYSFFDAEDNIQLNVLQFNNKMFPGLYTYITDLRSRPR